MRKFEYIALVLGFNLAPSELHHFIMLSPPVGLFIQETVMKELPYFKFYPGEWIKGDVTDCSMAAQGLFINICVLYWMKGCNLTLTRVQRKFNTCSIELKELLNEEIIVCDGDKIYIDFLIMTILGNFVLTNSTSTTPRNTACALWHARHIQPLAPLDKHTRVLSHVLQVSRVMSPPYLRASRQQQQQSKQRTRLVALS